MNDCEASSRCNDVGRIIKEKGSRKLCRLVKQNLNYISGSHENPIQMQVKLQLFRNTFLEDIVRYETTQQTSLSCATAD